MLLLILGGAMVAVAVLALVLAKPAEQAEGENKAQARRLRSAADRAPLLTKLLARTHLNRRLQQEILAAGLLLRPSELVAGALGLSGAAFVTVLLIRHSLPLALLASLAGLAAPFVWLSVRKAKREKAFMQQLPEAMELIATALKSGYSFARAVQLLAEQAEKPMSEEAQRIVDELQVGISLEEALDNLATRHPSYDVKLFVAAVQIQTRIGGNLAEILLKTAAMIRERMQLQQEIAALTAEGRLSAGILAALPIFLATVVNFLSPGYLKPMLEDPLGRYMLLAGGGLLLMGMLTIKRLLTVDL